MVRTSSIWTGPAKTDTQPLPLRRLACDVLKEREKEQASEKMHYHVFVSAIESTTR